MIGAFQKASGAFAAGSKTVGLRGHVNFLRKARLAENHFAGNPSLGRTLSPDLAHPGAPGSDIYFPAQTMKSSRQSPSPQLD